MHIMREYRHLLKAVVKHVGKEDYKRHFREFISEEFRKNSKLLDPSSIQQKIKLAHDYTFLLNSVHHHKVQLFFCYFSFSYTYLFFELQQVKGIFFS